MTQMFCVPHAGGGARTFRHWAGRFGDGVDLVALELPGRGRRIHDQAPATLEEAAHDLATELRQKLTGDAYVLLGHSLGSLIAYEMAARRPVDQPPPRLLIVAGRNPPHIPGRLRVPARMSDEALMADLVRLGGAPPGLSVSLAGRYFLPTLRSDLRLAADRHRTRAVTVLDVPILVLAGRADPLVDADRLMEWGTYTSAACHVELLAGGHFFLHQQPESAAQVITAHLQRSLAR